MPKLGDRCRPILLKVVVRFVERSGTELKMDLHRIVSAFYGRNTSKSIGLCSRDGTG